MNIATLLGVIGLPLGLVGLGLTLRGLRDLRKTRRSDALLTLIEALVDTREATSEWPDGDDRVAYAERYGAALRSLRRQADEPTTPPSVRERIGHLPDERKLVSETGYIAFSQAARLCSEGERIVEQLRRSRLWKVDRRSLWLHGKLHPDRRPLAERYRLWRYRTKMGWSKED